MIKHLILVGNKEDVGNVESLESNDNGFCINTIEVGNKKFGEFYFKHNGTVNKFSFPLDDNNILLKTPVSILLEYPQPTTVATLTARESFYVPNLMTQYGMLINTKVETEGKIVPGKYGFMLVKKNVPFNERNKWYVELLVKEETSYEDFATLLEEQFKAIDENLSVTAESSNIKVEYNKENTFEDLIYYTLTLDQLASLAFDIDTSSDIKNNPLEDRLKKLTTEVDADYGFDYTETSGENLYKGRNPEAMYKEMETYMLENNNLYLFSIKLVEPSMFRTVDPRINQSYTFIGKEDVLTQIFNSLFPE